MKAILILGLKEFINFSLPQSECYIPTDARISFPSFSPAKALTFLETKSVRGRERESER